MTSDFEEHQKSLRIKFAARTMEEGNQLAGFANDLAANDNADTRTAVRNLAHRLAGGAAIFGLDQLTQPAVTIEQSINDDADADIIIQQVRALVALIQQTAE